MSKAKSCKIGKADRRTKAREDYLSRPRMRGAAGSPVGSLPAPPAPNTPKDIACGSAWDDAYADAVAIESEQKHLASMQAVYEMAKAQKPINQPLLAYIGKQIVTQQELIRMMTNALAQQVAWYLACIQGVKA